MIPFQIKKLIAPVEFRQRRLESDLLWYGPSDILVGVHRGKVLGSIRMCREVGNITHGLLTDLFFEDEYKQTLPRSLIQSGEYLLKEKDALTFSALVIDGRGLIGPFYKAGYKPVRRTVSLTWDLKNLPAIEVNPSLVVKTFDKPTPAIIRFIHDAYSPYWVPWKGKSLDFIDRMVPVRTRFFAVYQGKEMVGLTEPFVFGPMMQKGIAGQKIGSTMMASVLQWFKDQGKSKAQWTVPSGLDDYDPVVYLSTLSTGAKIEREYIILEKQTQNS
ncbi:MAG: hypothetical protein Q8R11_03105 [bacterium]|nr:hypothetical protein [bacterium]